MLAGVPCDAFWHRLLLPCAFLRAAVLAALCFCRVRKNVSFILFKMAHGFYRWSIPAHISALVYWFKASIYMVKVKMVLLWWVPFLTEIVTWLQWEQKGCNEELPSVSYSEMGHDPYLMQLLILQPFIPAAERKLAKEQLCYVGNSTISLQPWNCTACLKLQWAEQTPLSAHWQNTGGFPRHSLSRKKSCPFHPPCSFPKCLSFSVCFICHCTCAERPEVLLNLTWSLSLGKHGELPVRNNFLAASWYECNQLFWKYKDIHTGW